MIEKTNMIETEIEDTGGKKKLEIELKLKLNYQLKLI